MVCSVDLFFLWFEDDYDVGIFDSYRVGGDFGCIDFGNNMFYFWEIVEEDFFGFVSGFYVFL